MKNLILILTVLLLPICSQAQKVNQVFEKWFSDSKRSKPAVFYIAKYEGMDGSTKSFNIYIEKSKTQRPTLMIGLITDRINESFGFNLQAGDNKVINIPCKEKEAVVEDCYININGEKIDVLQQLLTSTEATIVLDDAMGMAHVIKVPLADFQKEYAKLN